MGRVCAIQTPIGEKAERPQSVIDGDNDQMSLLGKYMTVVLSTRANQEGTTMNPHHHRKRLVGRVRSINVEKEAVLRAQHPLITNPGLCALIAGFGSIQSAGPSRGWLRRAPTLIADRRGSVRNAKKCAHLAVKLAANLSHARLNHRCRGLGSSRAGGA